MQKERIVYVMDNQTSTLRLVFASRNQPGTHSRPLRHPKGLNNRKELPMSSTGIKSFMPSLLVAGTLCLASSALAESTSTAEPAAVPATEVATHTSAAASTEQSGAPIKANAATHDLGGTATSPKNTKGIPVKKVSAKTDKMNKETAKAVNKVPGVNIKAADLQPPAEDPPITGFHPIKKLLRPVIRLGKGAVEIQQSMMKLEGPVAGLQPSMTSLGNKMTTVDHQMAHMQKQLTDISGDVGQIDACINRVGTGVDEVRQDIAGIRQQVAHLTVPIREMQKPLHEMLAPLKDVTKPMSQVHGQLAELKTMLRGVVIAIIVGVLAITIGTPFAAVYVYRNRKKLFPHLREPGNDLPIETRGDKTLSAA
jgi:CII-binding regulator of phage lambda lysogenization HflD